MDKEETIGRIMSQYNVKRIDAVSILNEIERQRTMAIEEFKQDSIKWINEYNQD